jgi:hypothetical protein
VKVGSDNGPFNYYFVNPTEFYIPSGPNISRLSKSISYRSVKKGVLVIGKRRIRSLTANGLAVIVIEWLTVHPTVYKH